MIRFNPLIFFRNLSYSDYLKPTFPRATGACGMAHVNRADDSKNEVDLDGPYTGPGV